MRFLNWYHLYRRLATACLLILFHEPKAVESFGNKMYKNFSDSNKLQVVVGLIYDTAHYNADGGAAALYLAETDLRKDGRIQSWVDFEYIVKDGCDLDSGIVPAIDLHYLNQSDVIIGPACDSAMIPTARVAQYWQQVIISYSSTASDFNYVNHPQIYQTFLRTMQPIDKLTRAICNVMFEFGWQTIGLISNDDGSCKDFLLAFNADLNTLISGSGLPNLTATVQYAANMKDIGNGAPDFDDDYRWLRTKARIFVVCPGNSPHAARPLFLRIAQMNLTDFEDFYVIPWIFKDEKNIDVPFWHSLETTKADPKDALVKEMYKHTIVPTGRQILRNSQLQRSTSLIGCGTCNIQQDGVNSTTFTDFNNRIYDRMKQAPISRPASIPLPPYLRLLRHAMYLYGLALNKSIEDGIDYQNGMLLAKKAFNSSFPGLTETIHIDDMGSRKANYTLFTMSPDSREMTLLASLQLTNQDANFWQSYSIQYARSPHWFNDDNGPPPDTPDCGWFNTFCQPDDYSSVIIGVVVAGVVIILILAFLIAWRVKINAEEKELMRMSWKIERHEIHKISKGRTARATEDASKSMTSTSDASASTSTRSSGEERRLAEKAMANDNGMLLFNKAPFIGVGDFREQRVAVKQIRQFVINSSFSKKELMTLTAMKDLRHDNLNTFIGLCISSNPGLVVWAYCQRGSLEDVLFNDHIELDMMFKASMMRDLAKALDYLHKSSLSLHGSLSTTNCVVDGRWVLKLTDFGLHDVMRKLQAQSKSLNEIDDQFYTQGMFHMAPEILRQAFERKVLSPTKQGDIYALAMILFQILYQIVRKLAYPGMHQVLRPSLPKRSGMNHGFSVLLNLCWDENPLTRPAMGSIKESVYALSKSYNANIIDHVIKIMEQYTQNLEKVVEERTKELESERLKADMLLREMLPKTVADELKAGKSVMPESYESATIYFSDVDGFAHICQTSTPLEIVNMLNLLYSGYDAISRQYDVYKVETIGDAYMVASGLPIRNGLRHVTEICNMALHIRKFVADEFVIPHRTGVRLRIRVGIHTGAAAAGVIGLAMPRYCVFGDTVNTASRMESTGEAMKIQISGQTAKYLQMRREYLLESRGQIEVKGKGMVETFWLIDRIPIVEAMN